MKKKSFLRLEYFGQWKRKWISSSFWFKLQTGQNLLSRGVLKENWYSVSLGRISWLGDHVNSVSDPAASSPWLPHFQCSTIDFQSLIKESPVRERLSWILCYFLQVLQMLILLSNFMLEPVQSNFKCWNKRAILLVRDIKKKQKSKCWIIIIILTKTSFETNTRRRRHN